MALTGVFAIQSQINCHNKLFVMFLTSLLLFIAVLVANSVSGRSVIGCTIKGDSVPYESIQVSEDLVLNCTAKVPVRWLYPRQQGPIRKIYSWHDWNLPEGTEIRTTEPDKDGNYASSLTVPNVIQNDTGVYQCVHEENESAVILQKFYYVIDDAQLVIIDKTLVFGFKTKLVIPCRPALPHVEISLIHDNIGLKEDGIECDPRTGFTFNNITFEQYHAFTCSVKNLKNNHTEEFLIETVVRGVARTAETIFINATYFHQNVSEGSNVTLNCTSDEAFSLDWYKLPELILFPEPCPDCWIGDIPTLLLKFWSIKKNDSGEYVCRADDGKNGLTAKRVIHVFGEGEHFLDLFLGDHSSQNVCLEEGEDFEWVVNISSSDIPQIQWFHNNTPIIGMINFFVETGSDWTKLKKINATLKDTGIYRLDVKHAHKSAGYDFKVTVTGQTKIKVYGETEQMFLLNKPYSLNCSSEGSSVDVKWIFYSCKHRNECLTFNSQTRDEMNEGIPWLNNLLFYANEPGYLECVVTNSICNTSKMETVTVRIIDMPTSNETLQVWRDVQEVIINDNVTLFCGASKYEYANEVNWINFPNTDETTMIQEKSVTDYTISSMAILHSVTQNNSGNYTCKAKRISGNDKEITMEVIVHTPQPAEATVSWKTPVMEILRGDSSELICNSSGTPTPSTIWKKNGEILTNDSKGVKLHRNNATLMLERFAEEEQGLYQCIVANKLKNSTTSVELLLKEQPLPPWLIFFMVICLISLAVLSFILIRKRRKERKLKKELALAGLANFEKGVPECINPDLPVDEQADLLPYEKKWEFPKERLHIGIQLGTGAFGIVFKAEAEGIVPEENRTIVAVKMAKSGLVDRTYIRALASELKIMAHLGQHLNVVNLLGACTKNLARRMELLVIVEFCCHGNLHDYMLRRRHTFIDQRDPQTGEVNLSIGKDKLMNTKTSNYSKSKQLGRLFSRSASTSSTSDCSMQAGDTDRFLTSGDSVEQPDWRVKYGADYQVDENKNTPFCTHDLLSWAFQVACGMKYLASRRVLHGDLALRNLLLAENNIVKICDFGLAKSMYKNNNYQKKSSGPLPIKWMAPESIIDHVFSTQSDVWSYGIVLWELFSLARTPYPGMHADENLYLKLKNGLRMEIPQYATKPVYKVMLQCWNGNPRDRPTFSALAEYFEVMLDDSLKRHFDELSTPYVHMNAQLIGEGNLLDTMMSPDYENVHIEGQASRDDGNEDDPNEGSIGNYLPMSASPRSPDEVFEFPSKDMNNISLTVLKNNETNICHNIISSKSEKDFNNEPVKKASNFYINLNSQAFSNPNYAMKT